MTKRRNVIVHIATSAEDLPSVERFEDGLVQLRYRVHRPSH